MKVLRVLAAVVIVPLFLAGCASSGGGLSKQAKCVILGAAVGGVAGAVLGDEAAAGGLVGGVSGSILGGIVCDGAGADSDGDGVPDSKDVCPNTPAGAEVYANGCAKDSDGDGVPDYRDKCPNSAVRAKVDADGCEMKMADGDADGDGVADSLDQCPNSPKGWQVDSRGCRVPVVLRGVNFAHDSAALSSAARKILDEKVAKPLRDNPAVRVKIIGHTDSQGTEAYNQGLSERRANSVADYLFTRGVQRSRMSTEGRGESDPVAPNSVDAGRAQNRRVELFALK